LRHDAVHATERADVDDTVGALLVEVDRLPSGEHHLAQGPVVGQVRLAHPEDLAHIVRLLVADEVVLPVAVQGMLVGTLDLRRDDTDRRLDGVLATLRLEATAMLVVGVPDPLADVGEPALAAVLLDHAHEVEVRERVRAAEDLAHDADEGPRAVVVGGDGAEPVARLEERGADGGQTLAV